MIDLDKAQLELSETQGWDPVLRVSGRVIRLRHPSRFQPVDTRKGLLPALGLLGARVWRLVFGGSEIAALRREVLAAVEEGDTDSQRAVRSLGLWELTLVYRAVQDATKGLGERVAAAALAARSASQQISTLRKAANQDDVKGRSAGVERAVTGVGNGITRGPDVPLRIGQRLPWFLGGGLWGSALAEQAIKTSTTTTSTPGDAGTPGMETQTNA